MEFNNAVLGDINTAIENAWQAFYTYRKTSLKERADFLRTIANELETIADEVLIHTAMKETNLAEARLKNEKARTVFQLTSYADACEDGNWLEACIDTANPVRNPPKPDIRKMLVPLGPVVVFGASNFPFAFSTIGSDTACALAAGCPVIVKAHPAHPVTSEIMAEIVKRAADKCNIPEAVFTHLYGVSNAVGRALVVHPLVKAVGFTGSYIAGKQLFDWANQRNEPIPVYAEMGSINPVFLLPEKLNQASAELAKTIAASITLGNGQFCTNPGLLVGIDGENLNAFISCLGKEIKQISPGAMLHPGIAKSYRDKRKLALSQKGVETVAVSEAPDNEVYSYLTIASATAEAFISNPVLHQEVFGPYSIIIKCRSLEDMITVAKHIEGQLTCTLMATENDIKLNGELIELIKNICGRIILNAAPTGVEVCKSMHHGGPFPATTNSKFTSVGADGIKRFARPLSFQNWPDKLLPDDLKNDNPNKIWRTTNNKLSQTCI